LKLIKYLKTGRNTWSSLRQAFKKEGLRVSDSQLNSYLKELAEFGFIEKITDKYFVTDPLFNLI